VLDILFQRPISALMPTRPPPRMSHAPPQETLLGTQLLLLELASHPRLWLPHIQAMLSIFNFSKRVIPFQKLTSAPTPTRRPLKMSHAQLQETLLGTQLLPQELASHLRPWLPHTQAMPSMFSSVLMDTPFQRQTFAQTPTRRPLRMRPAPPQEIPLGTPLLPLELASHPRLWLPHTQAMPSTSSWRLPLFQTSAPTPTRLPPRMRTALRQETLPGTPLPPPELEIQQTPWPIHIQDTLSTEDGEIY